MAKHRKVTYKSLSRKYGPKIASKMWDARSHKPVKGYMKYAPKKEKTTKRSKSGGYPGLVKKYGVKKAAKMWNPHTHSRVKKRRQ